MTEHYPMFNYDKRALAGYLAKDAQTPLDIRTGEDLTKLHDLQLWGALVAAEVLNIAAKQGHIELSQAQKVLDFGAGSGGPTLALRKLSELNGGSVEAIETQGWAVDRLVACGILSLARTYVGDGLAFLKEAHISGRQYDLVTAFMLGPDEGTLTAEFLGLAIPVIAPDGHVVITSDFSTMVDVRRVCDSKGLTYEAVEGGAMELGALPDRVIISPS